MGVPKGIFKTTTKAGSPVIVYTDKAGGDKPIHGAYESFEGSGVWYPCAWTAEGRIELGRQTSLDIIL